MANASVKIFSGGITVEVDLLKPNPGAKVSQPGGMPIPTT
jgi:hypothetical protein